MERILLYLDNVDDWVFAVAFAGERRGHGLRRHVFGIAAFLGAAATTWVVFATPALSALALSALTLRLALRSLGTA